MAGCVCVRGGRGGGVTGLVRNGRSVDWREKKSRCKDRGGGSPPHTFLGGGANLMISSSEGWRMMSLKGMGKEGREREREREIIRNLFFLLTNTFVDKTSKGEHITPVFSYMDQSCGIV